MAIEHFPLTYQIRAEAGRLISALDSRSRELKHTIETQPLAKQISIVVLKTLGLEGAMVTAAALPVAVITFTAAPLIVAAISLATAITCLAISIFLDPRSHGESNVKDQWKALFKALQSGDGKTIIQICQQLARQSEQQHSSSFVHCLGGMQAVEVAPFFHKICMAGYLLIAFEELKKGQDEEAKSYANRALSHFDQSHLPKEIETCAKEIADNPQEIRRLMDSQGKEYFGNNLTLKNLDSVLVMKRQVKQKNGKKTHIH